MGARCTSSTFVDTNVTAHTTTVTNASCMPAHGGAALIRPAPPLWPRLFEPPSRYPSRTRVRAARSVAAGGDAVERFVHAPHVRLIGEPRPRGDLGRIDARRQQVASTVRAHRPAGSDAA